MFFVNVILIIFAFYMGVKAGRMLEKDKKEIDGFMSHLRNVNDRRAEIRRIK